MPWSFEGRLRRWPYVLMTAAVFLGQYVVALPFALLAEPPQLGWHFLLMPLHAVARGSQASNATLVAFLVVGLLVAWALAALAFRRANDADQSGMLAAFALTPLTQIPVFIYLALAPTSEAPAKPPDYGRFTRPEWQSAVRGILIGMALTVAAVALSTLVFGAYGAGLFIVVPFVVGAVTAFNVNDRGDIGGKRTTKLVLAATALGALALMLFAIEGAICIVMAAPLGLLLAYLGGLVGRLVATHEGPRPGQTLASVAVLPLVFAAETLVPSSTPFEVTETIAVEAAPAKVWATLLNLDMSSAPLGLPYRLGLAHPKRGWVVGEGVGAIRYGEFSTGTAIERVTEWVPNELITFVVEKDVPAMRELSPYVHVHAPHAVDYFKTGSASFALKPRAGGGTDIVLRTQHTLRLEPMFYWVPLARMVVRGNNQRVLGHVKRQAEVMSSPSASSHE